MATHSSILAWRNPIDRRARRATVHKVFLVCLKFNLTEYSVFLFAKSGKSNWGCETKWKKICCNKSPPMQ